MSDSKPLEGDLLPVADHEYLPEVPLDINPSVDPSDVIKTTQGIRMAMVKQHLRGGTPSMDKDSNTFLQVLRDLDQAALTTRKIDVEERSVSESERLAQAQNELLRMLGGKNPFVIDIATGAPVQASEHPEVTLPEPKLVPDVTTQGTQPVNYDDFVQSVEASEAAMLEERD